MECVNRRIGPLHKTRLALAVLPLATVGAVLTTTAHSAQADQIRVCENYSVVRDRSDREVALLPRRSVAYCARSYQTLFQSYRVLSGSPDLRAGEANGDPGATRSQAENSTSTSSGTDIPVVDTVEPSTNRDAR